MCGVLEFIKSETFWSAVTAIATLAGVGAIAFAARQFRFDAFLRAQDFWNAEQFRKNRGEIFARFGHSQRDWGEEDKVVALDVCRKIDEFVHLAPYLGKRRMLYLWGNPIAKAWVILKGVVKEERDMNHWQEKWKAFQKFGEKALKAHPRLLTQHTADA